MINSVIALPKKKNKKKMFRALLEFHYLAFIPKHIIIMHFPLNALHLCSDADSLAASHLTSAMTAKLKCISILPQL